MLEEAPGRLPELRIHGSFTGAIDGGSVGLHGIVGMAFGIAPWIFPITLLRRLRRV